jgi:hypothetical protein
MRKAFFFFSGFKIRSSHNNRPIRKAQLLVHWQTGEIRSTEKKGHTKVSGHSLSRLSQQRLAPSYNTSHLLSIPLSFSLAGKDAASVEA